MSDPAYRIAAHHGSAAFHHAEHVHLETAGRTRRGASFTLAPDLGRRDARRPLRGRTDLLNTLRARLAPGQGDGAQPGGLCVLHGLGGSGKTALALELAYEAEAAGTQVWWVRAADGVAAQFAAIAEQCGADEYEAHREDAPDVLWRLLRRRAEPWLLVVDNVNDAAVLDGVGTLAHGTGWVRTPQLGGTGTGTGTSSGSGTGTSTGTGLVLVTTRDGARATWGNAAELHRVGPLEAADAGQVLLDSTQAPETERAAAEELAVALGGLPIALRLAGSYLYEAAGLPASWREPGTPDDFASYRAAFDRAGLSGLDGERAVARAWDMSLDLLERRGMPRARALLGVLAAFAEAPVPYELLLAPGRLTRQEPFAGMSPREIMATLRGLADFGLVDFADEPVQAVTLHPLVRETAADSAGGAAAGRALELLADACRHDVPEQPEKDTHWHVWDALLPHLLHLCAGWQPSDSDRDEDLAADELGLGAVLALQPLAARTLLRRGEPEQALALLDDQLLMTEMIGEPPELRALTLLVRYFRGMALAAMHRSAPAREALAEVADDLARAEPAVRDALSGLGPVIEQCREMLDTMAATPSAGAADRVPADRWAGAAEELGTAGVEALAAMMRAAQLCAQGRWREAVEVTAELVGREAELSGGGRLAVLTLRSLHATALAGVERWTEALAVLRPALDEYTEVWGETHPNTLGLRSLHCRVLAGLEEWPEALAEAETLLACHAERGAPGAVSALTVRLTRVRALSGLGRHADAVAEAADCLAAARAAAAGEGAEPRLVSSAVFHHARALHEAGRTAEAVPEYERARELDAELWGPEHPHTLEGRRAYARALADTGRTAEARTELAEVLRIWDRLGPDGAEARTAREALAGLEAPDTERTEGPAGRQ